MASEIDLNKLKGVIPDSVLEELPQVIEKFNCNTPLRLAHFLAQCAHESGNFKDKVENLNYSADGLKKNFGSYFPGDTANSYAKNPEKIASRVYGDRLGNGPENTKEGFAYRGRGYIQLTGKSNYKKFKNFSGSDVVQSPDIIITKFPLSSAGFFFNDNNLWTTADGGSTDEDVKKVTKKVNGGYNGLADRLEKFKKFWKVLKPDPNDSQKPKIEFTFGDKAKPGETVTINNKTANATSFIWSANPSASVVWNTATSSTPTVVFNQAGTYSLSLQASNSFGTSSFTSPVNLIIEPPQPPPNTPTGGSQSPTPVDPKSVKGKIKLVKKEGPGELVGVTEIEVVGGSASFTGIQFTKGGFYIIEAVPDSPELEKTEISITVEGEPTNIEQDKPAEEEKKDSGNRPIIAQIDESNQKIPPLKRPIQPNKDEALESAIGMGLKPLIGYNGAEVAREVSIKSLLIYYERGGNYDNIPLCKTQFADSNGLIKDNPPRDDTKFQIFLNSTDDLVKSIHLVFKILNHKKQPDGTYLFEGVLDVDDLYVPSSKSYKGTSFDVLRKIAKKLDLGFNSNIDGNTDDEMKWINTNKEYKDFIKEIVEHSFKDDKTFLYGFIDFYYCFNYIDVEKEWKRVIKGDKMVETSNADRTTKDKETKIVDLLLTNEPSQRTSCGYFQDFKVLNQSTSTKIKEGYRTVTRYYDEEKKSFLDFEVDSQSNSDGTTHTLKGETGDNKFLDKKVKKKFLGKFDSDNVHKNYNYAPEQNRKNLENLTSVAVMINLPNPNYNLYRFQKVPIMFYIIDSSPSSNSAIDHRYTGEWMIIDISFEMVTSPKGNRFVQKLICVRKELGKNPEELRDGDKSATPEKKEGNPNEAPETNQPKPNAKYKVGDKVQVVQNDGTKYEITVTNVLENGIEIEGTMKKV